MKSQSEPAAFEVPLFPLRTVLFPGGLLPLKVFEQRYIDMTKACLRDDRPFGVCLLTRGNEVATAENAPLQTADVGTLARIVNWDMPQLGIFHITTEGGARFRIRSHSVEPTGLVIGDVVPIADEAPYPLDDAYAALARVLETIAQRIGAQNFPSTKRYDDATWVGYRLAELLPLPLTIKQSMLEINDARLRLHALKQFMGDQGLL